MTTTNLLRGEETGRTTRKLTAIKSLDAGMTESKGLHPGASTEQREKEVLLRPVNIRQQEQLCRPNSQNGQISHPSSLNDQTDGTVHPNNPTTQPDPQEIRMTKRHVWRKSCEK